MAITLITFPKFKLTLGATEFENVTVDYAKVIRNENGFDLATFKLNDTTLYPATVTTGTAVQFEVGEKGSAYPTNPMFKGVCRFPIIELAKKPTLTLSCLGAGYGFGQMLAAQEYGSQSANPTLDTITEILTDATHGIIPRYVNRVFEAGAEGDSGFEYDDSDVDAINDVIKYIDFPYKKADKSINDLVDCVTALKASTAGPHWIVTTDDHFRMKLLTSTQAGEWDKYYGASQANATLEYGEHYEQSNFEVLGPEGNYIVYFGAWRRPSNGDSWTENSAAAWGADAGFNTTMSNEAVVKIVDTYSVKALHTNPDGDLACVYPSARNAGWDFSIFTDFNTPTLNFYIATNNVGANPPVTVSLKTDNANYYTYNLSGLLAAANTFYHVSLPIGTYYNVNNDADKIWSPSGAPDWSSIDYIQFYWVAPADYNHALYIDGLHFGGASVCRVAYDSDISPYAMKLITDNVGKDDSLLEADDSGLMAQLAYAELLRASKTTVTGWTKLKGIIPEALPGQWFHQQEDMRAQKLVHEMLGKFSTTLYLTDDLTNGQARMRYEDVNKVYENMRPEWQDRQASSIKAGSVDWRVPRLEVDY